MRVRVIQDPNGVHWHVQRRRFFRWETVRIFYLIDVEGSNQTIKDAAIEFAQRLKNPEVIEV